MSADAELLGSALEYFPETGVFVWKVSPSSCIAAGAVAGSIDAYGYRVIRYRGVAYKAHRIAWLLMNGGWPPQLIDHRNCDRSDNRWVNLRLATHAQNNTNSRGHGKFSKGACLTRHGKFVAQITINNKCRHLGYFQTAEEASAAYAAAAKEYFGEFARTA